ncbi:hypothetical protein D918_01607, partial [Trichuris suis]
LFFRNSLTVAVEVLFLNATKHQLLWKRLKRCAVLKMSDLSLYWKATMPFYQPTCNESTLDELLAEEILEEPVHIILISVGIIAFLGNALLFVTIVLKKRISGRDKFCIGFCFGSMLLAISYVLEYGRMLTFHESVSCITILQCNKLALYPTVHTCGTMVVSVSILVMAVQMLVAATYMNVLVIERYLVKVYLVLCTLSSLAVVIGLWVYAWMNQNEVMPSFCYFYDAVSYFGFCLALFCVITFKVTLILYFAACFMLRKRKSAISSELHAIQLRRQFKYVKQFVLETACTTLFQYVPNLLDICHIAGLLDDVPDLAYCSEIIGLILYALLCLMCDRERRVTLVHFSKFVRTGSWKASVRFVTSRTAVHSATWA